MLAAPGTGTATPARAATFPACSTPTHGRDDLRDSWRWSEKYATQPEILAYAEHVADRYDLRPAFLFETKVVSAVFDEATGRWRVETDQGQVFDARFCIMATGCLSVPRVPDLPGATSFKGKAYVTGQWPHEGVDFTGKRVGHHRHRVVGHPVDAADRRRRGPGHCVPAHAQLQPAGAQRPADRRGGCRLR